MEKIEIHLGNKIKRKNNPIQKSQTSLSGVEASRRIGWLEQLIFLVMGGSCSIILHIHGRRRRRRRRIETLEQSQVVGVGLGMRGVAALHDPLH